MESGQPPYNSTHFGQQRPKLKAQEEAHRAYTLRLQELLRQSIAKPHVLSLDVLQFLKEWWLNHILKIDRA
jgi:hemerythrin